MTNSDADEQPAFDKAGPILSPTDVAQVFDLLRGAGRSTGDPDIELAEMIASLRGASDEQIRSAFLSLVKDADRD